MRSRPHPPSVKTWHAVALLVTIAGVARAQGVGSSAGHPLIGPAQSPIAGPSGTASAPLVGPAIASPASSNTGWLPKVGTALAGVPSSQPIQLVTNRGAPLPQGGPAPQTVAPLPVPLINQNSSAGGPPLPNGCEATSLAMVLGFAGANVNKNLVFDRLPRSQDPNAGFNGMGVYHGPSAATAQQIVSDQHLPIHIVDYTGKPFDQVLASTVGQGRPVQIVTNATFRPLGYNVDLTRVPPDEHSVVIVGYDQTTITIRDPLLNKNSSYPNSNGTLSLPRGPFEAAWQQMGSQAVGYEPN